MSKQTAEQIDTWVRATVAKLGLPPKGRSAKNPVGKGELVILGRREDGTAFLRREWYVPESYGDDDLSSVGYYLEPRMGSSRKAEEITGEDIAERVRELIA